MRRLVRLARSAECRGIVSRGIAALALLFPLAMVVLDHHGVERIPIHVHLSSVEKPAVFHAHGFDTPHIHEPGAVVTTAPAVVASVPVAVLVLAFAQVAGLPLARPIAVDAIAEGRAHLDGSLLRDQLSHDPPTRPPASVA